MFLGYSLAAIMRPLLALVTSWPQVLVVRMADRIGKGIRGAPRDALLAASVPGSERGFAFGFNRAADHLGAISARSWRTSCCRFCRRPKAPDGWRISAVFCLLRAGDLWAVRDLLFRQGRKDHSLHDAAPAKINLRGFDGNFKRLLLVVIAVFTLSNSTDAFLLLRAGAGRYFARVAAAVMDGTPF